MSAFIAGDKQNRRFTSVHDSLFAKAVVMTRGDEQLAIVTLDCIGLLYPEVLKIRQQAAWLCGINEARIMVSSTHTHSGPDVVGLWGSDYQHPGVDSVYLRFLVTTAAEQVKLAFENRKEANAVVAETVFGEPWVQNICLEEIDRSVAMLQFTDEAGKAASSVSDNLLYGFRCMLKHIHFFHNATIDLNARFLRTPVRMAWSDDATYTEYKVEQIGLCPL